MGQRLVAQDWIDFGLSVLDREGFEALKAGQLSRELGETRGSFYRHFTDLADFHSRLIEHWQDLATRSVIKEIERVESPRSRLAELLRRAFSNTSGLEVRMRAWADKNAVAATALRAIDDQRTAYMARLLCSAGVEEAVADTRARLLYWSYLGALFSRVLLPPSDFETIVTELLSMAFAGLPENFRPA